MIPGEPLGRLSEEEEKKIGADLLNHILNTPPYLTLKVLQAVAMGKCEFFDMLLAVLSEAHHAKHNGTMDDFPDKRRGIGHG